VYIMKSYWHVCVAAMVVLLFLVATLPAADANQTTNISPTIKKTASPTPVIMGSISGTVFDMNHEGIPDAKVTLYVASLLNKKYVNIRVAGVDNNPQYTIRGGLFLFENVPKGVYNITVEKNGRIAFKIVNVTEGTISPEIYMKDYIHVVPSPSSEPSMTPSPSPVPTPTPTVKPSIRPTPTPYTPDLSKIIFETARLALMAVVGVQFIAGAAIFLYMKKLKRV
jgi:hypothetical protein